MLAETLDDGLALAFRDFALDFIEGEVDDVVVMDFLVGKLFAELEPQFVKEIDFLGRETRSVRAKVEDILLTCGRENFQGDGGARVGHAFPSETNFAGLIRDSDFCRAPSDDRAGLQIHRSS